MVIKNLKTLENSNLGEYAKEQIRGQLQKNDNRNTNTSPDMERTFICKPLGTKKNPRYNTPVRVMVCTTRKAETDNRAVSEKAVVDGIVKAGILKNDTKKRIPELVVPEPEINENEKTLITIEPI